MADLCSTEGCFDDVSEGDRFVAEFGLFRSVIHVEIPLCEDCTVEAVHDEHQFSPAQVQLELLEHDE